jgi:hypothetical protein
LNGRDLHDEQKRSAPLSGGDFFTENLSSRWSSHSLIRAAIRHLPINKRNHFSIGARFRLRKSVMSSSSSVALREKLKKAPTDCKTKPREEKGRVSTIDHPSSCFKLFRVFCFLFFILFFKKRGEVLKVLF